jgi:predicted amidophosphoribosyltransferase
MVAAAPVPAVEVVTWVPLGHRRLAERGYDQARVLAQGVARRLDLPCVRLLRRPVSSDPQAGRSGADRRTALVGGYQPVEGAMAPAGARRVLLVDDVLTTGATATACAEALTAAGAAQVHVLAAARAFSGSAYTRLGPRPGLWLPGGVPR